MRRRSYQETKEEAIAFIEDWLADLPTRTISIKEVRAVLHSKGLAWILQVLLAHLIANGKAEVAEDLGMIYLTSGADGGTIRGANGDEGV